MLRMDLGGTGGGNSGGISNGTGTNLTPRFGAPFAGTYPLPPSPRTGLHLKQLKPLEKKTRPFPIQGNTNNNFEGQHTSPGHPHSPGGQYQERQQQQQQQQLKQPSLKMGTAFGNRSKLVEVDVDIEKALTFGTDDISGKPLPQVAHTLWDALEKLCDVPVATQDTLTRLKDALRMCIFSDYLDLVPEEDEIGAGNNSINDNNNKFNGSNDPISSITGIKPGDTVKRQVPYFSLIPRLESHLESAEAECARYAGENETLQKRLEASRAQIDGAMKQQVHAEDAAAEHRVKIHQLETELTVVSEKMRSLAESNTLAEQQIESLEERLSETQALPFQLKNLKTIVAGTEAKNEALQAELLSTLDDLRVAQEALSTMIPESKYGYLIKDLDATRKSNARLNGQLSVMLGKLNTAKTTIAEMEAANRSMTPRPDWDGSHRARARQHRHHNNNSGSSGNVNDRPPPPPISVQALIGDRVDVLKASSAQMAKAALEEIASVREQAQAVRQELAELKAERAEERDAQGDAIDRTVKHSTEDFFVARGTGPDVPKYLRYTGRIQNRRLGKGETEAFVRDVWEQKLAADRIQRKPDSLPEFFFKYLTKRFGRQAMVASWAYNLIHALERYRYDSDLELFLLVLKEELSIDVYHDQNALMERVQEKFRSIDSQINDGKESGVLPRLHIINALKKLFPGKTDERHTALRRALFRDAPGRDVDYIGLFEDDEDFNQGDFAETLCGQHMEEIKEYQEEVVSEIQGLEQTMETVRISDIRDAIFRTDPHKSGTKIEEYLYRGIGKDPKSGVLLKRNPVISDVSGFIQRMKSGLLKRSNRARSRAPTAAGKTRGGNSGSSGSSNCSSSGGGDGNESGEKKKVEENGITSMRSNAAGEPYEDSVTSGGIDSRAGSTANLGWEISAVSM